MPALFVPTWSCAVSPCLTYMHNACLLCSLQTCRRVPAESNARSPNGSEGGKTTLVLRTADLEVEGSDVHPP